MAEISNPLVSIIIPTYNCANYIERAILSALNQTYPDKEIIVIDDGSTDNTSQILEKYAGQIKVIYQENNGVAKARNTGISIANGKYIATLDADDKWLDNRLEVLIPIIESGDFDILTSNFYYVNVQGEKLYHANAFTTDYCPPQPNKQYESLLWTATAFGLMILEKTKFEEIGGYDVTLKGEAEDYDLWLRLLKEGAIWGYYPHPLAEITFRSGSLSKGYSKNRKIALQKIFSKHMDKIGKIKAFILYRYHLGGYRWDMIIISIKERNYKRMFTHSLIMLSSPFFIPIIFKRILNFIYRNKIKISLIKNKMTQ